MTISVIIPAYQQEKTIYQDIDKIKKILTKIDPGYEIVVVVDGDIDQTKKQAKRHRSSQIKVLSYLKNQGKGYAIRHGISKAKGEIVAFVDAGMKIDPDGLETLYKRIKTENIDIIVGSKRHPDSKIDYPLKRRLYSRTYQTLVKVLFGLQIKDTQAGLKLFRRPILDSLLPQLAINRYAFDVEILAVANHFGFKKITEAPIKVKYHPLSSVSLKTAVQMLYDTLVIFFKLKIIRSYKKID